MTLPPQDSLTSSKPPSEETVVVKGVEQVEQLAYAFLDRANQSYLIALADDRIPKDTAAAIEFTRQMFSRNPNFKFQLIADIQSSNVAYYKQVCEAGVEIRHIEGNKVSFAISENEYIATPLPALEELIATDSQIPKEIVWSTRRDLVAQAEQIFKVMWASAIPVDLRIRELEQGVEYSRIQVISDVSEIERMFLSLVSEAKREILIVFPTTNAFHREEIIGVIDLLEKKARESKESISIRAMSPLDAEIEKRITSSGWQFPRAEEFQRGFFVPQNTLNHLRGPIAIREIDASEADTTATIVILDRSKVLIIEQKDDSQRDFTKAIGLAIYSNSKPTVNSYFAFFQNLWTETDLREKEERSRKQSELLQDILTHDIRNYNQAARMGAEVLSEEARGNTDLEVIARTVIQAIDGSTQLVDKAKKLGRIIAEGKQELRPVDLLASIDRSLVLVKGAHPTNQVKEKRTVSSISPIEDSAGIQVLADDLLDEVFINIFSNAVKFTQGVSVPIDIVLEEKGYDPNLSSSWRITIGDYGSGISSFDKDSIFFRYSKRQKVTGLGLSIVHTLVVDRYGGQIKVRDRSLGGTGAIFEVSLRKA